MFSLKIASAVLGWCFLLCVGLQILTFVILTNLHDWAYSVHSSFFPSLTVETFDLCIYQMLMLLKIAGLVLFLIPWVAIKLVGKQEAKN